jgi:hypothetical protein
VTRAHCAWTIGVGEGHHQVGRLAVFDVRRRPGAVIGVVALAAAIGGGAYAAIPASDGSVRACYSTSNGLLLGIPYSKGDARIVDENEACRSYEKPISWSQRGPAGPRGAQGVQGLRGPQGLQGPAGVSDVLTANVAVSSGTAPGSPRLVAGGDATSVTNPATGRFVVTFASSVYGCAATASPGFTGGDSGIALAATVRASTNDSFSPNAVVLDFEEPSVGPQNTDFHLIVVC